MLSLQDLENNRFMTKQGDIKVDVDDLNKILDYLSFCQEMLGNMLNDLTEEEKQTLLKGIKQYEYFKNKYIVLGSIRCEQAMWFKWLKKFDNEEEMKKLNGTEEEKEELRRNILEKYLESKTARERLQKEIDSIEF